MADPESFSAGSQFVLILVGLIGSGKSTFAQAVHETFPGFIRCNQDELGDRRQVEHLARSSLRQGSSVVIDRTNFDASQRGHWIRIAHEFPGTLVWVLVFDTPKDVCAARLQTRTGHPTIQNATDALSILDRFSSQYRAPTADEGYDRILYLQPTEQELVYSPSSLAAILRRVRDAPVARSVGPTVCTPSPRGSPYYPRGGFSRGTRGRGGHTVDFTGHRGARNSATGGVRGWAVSGHRGTETRTSEPTLARESLVVQDSGHCISVPNDALNEGVSGL
ncbi:P-loop containing nucleoside triphosphate hydrolase protein [Mycena pura]|uniref:P-loop containing nucleoside triphosphate hydrolase protein n=1 Tax=Mycena pura TaxID=153505 RepID=A0AAD7E321_9AGAR|nr:P-loop containing nucleoside triphosphate hydrolase protein [Mycena pura]